MKPEGAQSADMASKEHCYARCQTRFVAERGRHTFWLGSGLAAAAGLAELATLWSSGAAGPGGGRAGLDGPLRAGTPPLSEGMSPVASQCYCLSSLTPNSRSYLNDMAVVCL